MTDKKATIVIVDDDPRLLTTLSINFKARGYEVYSASTGAEGLQAVSYTHLTLPTIYSV